MVRAPTKKRSGGMRAVVEQHGTGLESPTADLGGGVGSLNHPALPRWDDDAGMSIWLNIRLDAERDHFDIEEGVVPEAIVIAADGKKSFLARTPDHQAVERALALDYEPLARLLDAGASPWIQAWIAKHLRIGGFARREQTTERIDAKQRVVRAADDVRHIKRLWRTHFKRRNRAAGMKSAEAFAAERWDVPLSSLRKHLKTRNERRKSRSSAT